MEPWDHIFTSLGYNGCEDFIITADAIKRCGKTWKGAATQFEPRLLCYQTSADTRPGPFKKHGLNILPIKNGTYLITKNNLYMPLSYTKSNPIDIQTDKSSLILSLSSGEKAMIDNMYYSGVFEREEFLGEKITHGPLLGGRHRINTKLTLDGKEISIEGVQYETDACFESANKILLIEAKAENKLYDSFNIRQLYFPYIAIKQLVGDKKTIVPVFIHLYKDIIYVWKYTFTKGLDSMLLTGYYTYKFNC
jgi:hypothetical protein